MWKGEYYWSLVKNLPGYAQPRPRYKHQELQDSMGHEAVLIDTRRLTSFLQKDDSFLTPWCWDPNAFDNKTSSSVKEKEHHLEYLQFDQESYFSTQVIFLIYN